MAKTIYISGPMTGHTDKNKEAFMEAEERLTRQGWRVINPARIGRDLDCEYSANGMRPQHRDYLAQDLHELCTHADAVYMLSGWRASLGATTEHTAAKALSLHIIHAGATDEELRQILNS